ncbi:FGFR1 oncogene partner isoform X3 [Callorhinchus milii]|uniref:FGFR1 oncogene partner isoform X3 n=1 Tax=Callorhinchus milii TaxID=7868 RepID=UPI001C3F8E89|nr:FGFR1 oncogene partner isoform X3 [Callorhinchus milii]
MSAAEEDTELRDLLVQTLESSGLLNKIKAELRAAVFLALEEQEKVENKTPLVNENLKKFLNTKDGRLVASLVTDFLQFFNLDFTLAVFQPEASTFTGLEGRENVAQELGIHESEGMKGAPILLEVMRRSRQKEKDHSFYEELSAKQMAEARKKFDFYDKDKNGEISKDELRELFMDLFPHFHKNMLERYVNDEFRAVDKDFNNVIDFDEFLGMYKRLFIQCRSVVTQDGLGIVHSSRRFPEGRQSASSNSKNEEIPRYKGTGKVKESGEKAGEKVADMSVSEASKVSGDLKSKINQSCGEPKQDVKPSTTVSLPELNKGGQLDLDDEDEGDSFFDDPLPKQVKTYGCSSQKDRSISGLHSSNSKKKGSQKVTSDTNSDTDEEAEDPFVEADDKQSALERRIDKPSDGLTSLSDAPPLSGALGSLAGASPLKVTDKRGGDKSKELLDLKAMNENIGTLGLGTGDEEDYYDDDFISGSQRSDKTKSDVSIGEEIEEDISIEGEDFAISDKLDDLTQDHTISQFSDVADYLEEVS